tara:strand:+ start:8025 stop:8381 length:357 start_codon:yes stop_codon:yes gene_type:complete
MATINLPFAYNINDSLQVGDNVYSCAPATTGQFKFTNSDSGITKLGTCSSISATSIQVDTGSLNFVLPVSGSFILFNKDNEANLNSVLGYYAEVKMVNNSKTEAELFAVSANVAESSK